MVVLGDSSHYMLLSLTAVLIPVENSGYSPDGMPGAISRPYSRANCDINGHRSHSVPISISLLLMLIMICDQSMEKELVLLTVLQHSIGVSGDLKLHGDS